VNILENPAPGPRGGGSIGRKYEEKKEERKRDRKIRKAERSRENRSFRVTYCSQRRLKGGKNMLNVFFLAGGPEYRKKRRFRSCVGFPGLVTPPPSRGHTV
jgi:hypothetical protein